MTPQAPGQWAEHLPHQPIAGGKKDGSMRARAPSHYHCSPRPWGASAAVIPMSWKADRSTARGVVCQSGGARICTQVLNSLIRSVLVWIPPEADLRQGFYLDSTGNMSWEHGEERRGRAAHKECVTKPATPVNIWSSTPPGNLGAREEDTSEGLRPQDKRAGVLRRALSH